MFVCSLSSGRKVDVVEPQTASPAFIAMIALAVALCGLVAPLFSAPSETKGWLRSAITRRSLVPLFMLLVMFSAVTTLTATTWWTPQPGDWIVLGIMSLAFGLGLTRDEFRGRPLTKFVISVAVVAGLVMMLGDRPIPFMVGKSTPLISGLVTIVFVLGVINAMTVLNFFDGFASLVTFAFSACLGLGMAWMAQSVPVANLADKMDAISGAMLALALAGGSLGFFLLKKPRSKAYLGDFGSVLMSLALALLASRFVHLFSAHSASIVGAETGFQPSLLVPIVLILPLLAIGAHREQMALLRRSRLALILIVLGHIPAWIPVLLPTPHAATRGMAILLALASTVAWSAMITQGRTMRGWAMRVAAEPIADVLWIAMIVTVPQVTLTVIGRWAAHLDRVPGGLADRWLLPCLLISGAATTVLLIFQVTVWRRRVQRLGIPQNVVTFGSESDYISAQNTFDNCHDVFGRRQISRSNVGLNSKRLRQEVATHLRAGETVLILQDSARTSLIGLRGLGDLIFASECVMMRHIDSDTTPAQPGPFAERMQDIIHRAMALVALFLLSPVFIALAILIRLDDGGPILFRQRRLGIGNRRFTLLKFRSMSVQAKKYGESPEEATDPRITRVGRIIRKLSLDELPQLINVLRGEMRLVGPRPEMPFICVRHYSERDWLRHDVPPGVTGLWQISPHRNEAIHEHIEYDLAYRHARSPLLDVAIIISTILGGTGGY